MTDTKTVLPAGARAGDGIPAPCECPNRGHCDGSCAPYNQPSEEPANIVKTAPETIYLIIDPDLPQEADFKEVMRSFEDSVKWCSEDSYDNGIKYVRADLAAAPAVSAPAGLIVQALELAYCIANRVPTRIHLDESADEAFRDIGRMVNAQDDGTHGYRLISDARDAANECEHALLAILERAGEGATVADVLDRLSIPAPQPVDGGPAFPRMFKYPNGHTAPEADGMSLRDYFAAKAMQGLLSAGGAVSIEPHLFANEAAMSYAMADAMLKARKA